MNPRPRSHPFACPAGRLSGALRDLGMAVESDTSVDRQVGLLLPSSRHGPERSPQLLRVEEDATPEAADVLQAWVVPAIGLAPGPALDLLLALPTADPTGVAVGESLRFLAEAGKLALELVARGRLLPVLERRDEDWLACWRSVTVDPNDAERMRVLSVSIPPLLRAELSSSGEGRAPEAVVRDLLDSVVDDCARRFAADGLVRRRGRGRAARSDSPADAWLAALTDENPGVRAGVDSVALAALAEELDAWRESGERYARHRTFRTCFRLCAPEDLPESAEHGPEERARGNGDGDDLNAEGTSPRWRVEILLQAKEDPSVLVPADDVWNANGNGVRILGRRIEDPQERLLGGLGHALRLWPELEPALREPAPTGLDLSQEAAYSFLRDAVPALEQAGFGVLAPAWWSQRLRLKLSAEPFDEFADGSGLFGLDGLCAYQWKVAVGDATLTLAELRELAALKLPLVMARGRWIVLRPEDVEAALAFFQGREERGEASAAELLRASLGLQDSQSDLPPTEIEADGWLAELLGTTGERTLTEIATPASFAGQLRPYQERGLAWLVFLSSLGLGACLADDMGLGKTPQLLALLLAEREQPQNRSAPPRRAGSGRPGRRPAAGKPRRKRIGPTLLICPMSVVGNWQREAERFGPSLRVHVHHGPDRLTGRGFARAARGSDLVLTTYALRHP